jgi:acylphosphatase
MEAPVSYNVRITGKVQGVGFRYAARKEAMRLGIRGFARNERDGSVRMEVEGSREAVDAFLEWCKKGFLGSYVEKITVTNIPIRNFEGFEIRYD